MNISIRPGKVWLDTNGKPIQAHGACVFYENGVYYWIGENKEFTDGKNKKIWTWGIRMYASRDLYNWEDLGLIVEPDLKNKKSVLHPSRKMDRPHLLYNQQTKKYVLWLKYFDQKCHYTVLTAENLRGPYTIVNECLRPFGRKAGDYDLAVDVVTGQGYLYCELDHTDVAAVKLNRDYTDVIGEPSYIYKGYKPPLSREGITHVLHNGKHYIISSGMTGYIPNPSEVAVSDDWMTGYTIQGNPHVNDASSASFNSQISGVFSIAGTGQLVAIADRWVPDFVMDPQRYDWIYRAIRSNYDRSVKATLKEKIALTKTPMIGTANTSIARYVWLPISFEGDRLLIQWHDEWKPDELKNS